MDREAAKLVAHKAFKAIQASPELWRLWCDAKESIDRDLLMVHMVFEQSFAEGFDKGYDEGYNDHRDFALDFNSSQA